MIYDQKTQTKRMEQSNPVVSFIIPAYEASETLGRCLDSILNIRDFPYEVLVIDDGSTDSTGKIAEDMFNGRPDCRLIAQENLGRSVARNVGIENAHGTWLMFVDADDRLLPDAGPLIGSHIESSSSFIVFQAESTGIESERSIFISPDEYIHAVFDGSFIPMPLRSEPECNAFWFSVPYMRLVRRSELGNVRFIQGLRFGEDAFFNIDYAMSLSGGIELVTARMYEVNTSTPGTIRTFRVADVAAVERYLRIAEARYGSTFGSEFLATFMGTEIYRMLIRAARYGSKDRERVALLSKFFDSKDNVSLLKHATVRGFRDRSLLKAASLLVGRAPFRCSLSTLSSIDEFLFAIKKLVSK